MSQLPDNWEEIKADKAFWAVVMDATGCTELPEDDDELHELAMEGARCESVFTFTVTGWHGEPTDCSIAEIAGKFYLPDFADPESLMGPYASVEAAFEGCVEVDLILSVHSSLPYETILALCNPSISNGRQIGINDIPHIQTDEGLIPA